MSIFDIGSAISYPVIVDTIRAKGQIAIMAERIAIKIGGPIVPYLNDFPKLIQRINFKK